MTFTERALGGRRLFVELPAAGVPEWVAAVEVLVQEGLGAVAFHVGHLDLLRQALPLFGRRARLGVWGALTPDDVAAAVASGAHFVTSPVGDPAEADAAGDIPFLPGGLTPTELAAAAREGEVQVVPADALPTAYARALPALLPGVGVVATGRLERFVCELWLTAGARAVGLSGVLWDANAPESGTLGDLRLRCQSYAGLVRELGA